MSRLFIQPEGAWGNPGFAQPKKPLPNPPSNQTQIINGAPKKTIAPNNNNNAQLAPNPLQRAFPKQPHRNSVGPSLAVPKYGANTVNQAAVNQNRFTVNLSAPNSPVNSPGRPVPKTPAVNPATQPPPTVTRQRSQTTAGPVPDLTRATPPPPVPGKKPGLTAVKKQPPRALPTANIADNRYSIGPVIGTGGFSQVCRGTANETNTAVAIKIVDKQVTTQTDREALAREVEILRNCQHENIVQLIEHIETDLKVYIVMELLSGGPIDTSKPYSEADAKKIMQQLLSAVKLLHERGVIHRDIKPENIIRTAPNTLNIKLIDFGLATYLDASAVLYDWCGTPEFQAPELITQAGYNHAADVWSIGVILYSLLSGQLPFVDNNTAKLNLKIRKGEYNVTGAEWQSVSEEAKDLVRRVLHTDPKQRYTVAQALNHPWFTGQPLASLNTAPVTKSAPRNRAVVQWDFTARTELELSARKGEVLTLLSVEGEWALVENSRGQGKQPCARTTQETNGVTGWMPFNYLQVTPSLSKK